MEQSFDPSPFIIEEVTNPVEIARHQAHMDAFTRNSDWLAGHWTELLPHARGKFVTVAAQEAFVAPTAEEAWAWAAANHPDDKGPLVRYVPSEKGPRIHANRRQVADM